ncbi:MAG TPA: CDP-alcohol phosphatidyltransferase family protein [Ktedonobacteraceae bacterium]|nr:CDP-alcohol phosphatidyltransferase family protein [Ktedonobacteraceae bacterium]
MLKTTDSNNQFVVDILTDLRNEHFSFVAWMHFLGSSWRRSRATARANPALKRSWIQTTIFIGVFGLAILFVNFIFEGPVATLHLIPGFLFCVAWQQSDLYWHLGLNRQSGTGTLLQVIGPATTLTWLRGLGASYLLGRFIGGITTPSWLGLVVFLSGIITDILDGQIARRTQTQTTLGQIADGEADFCLYVAIALILIQNNLLPLWFGLLILLRFMLPLTAATVSYFLFAHPVRFGSTIWGKAAGFALCCYFLTLLVPGQLVFLTSIIHRPLSIVTLLLLAIAPLAQFARYITNSKSRNFSQLRN